MNRVLLSEEIWTVARKLAQGSPVRKLAIAYVTEDRVGLRKGDILVCDASDRMIRMGQTDAKLLKRLHKDGVAIHSVPGLHAKVMLFGKHAIVGSANMSGSRLTEAAAVTDRTVITSGIASFIAQLAKPETELEGPDIARLCGIEVIRNGGRGGPKKLHPMKRLGSTTWIVGTHELVRDPSAAERKHIGRAMADLNRRHASTKDDYDWIQWSKGNKLADECREGDTIISIWSPRKKGRRHVTRGLPVLLKRNEPQFCRFYIGDPVKDGDTVSWTAFKRILSAAGYHKYVGPHSVQMLTSDAAEAIDRCWKRAARKAKS
ncbi:hypothetical protein [Bradyrhizobium sp. S3.5.5]|uniref:hypothetical protein n=1 Tax=Bradyrhizobium sp. S3.5.5 TaxID=3156430 RepID=UPI003397180E